ncbi:hypothetical protein [Geminisphaera colitermitum]|uniref:hypothetical protein n=1 Tax=Geminisphaera colitermitum TaxID=1148786 RepID=UPI000158D58E|nr:hypothetical protein [Geminisphaera colitermitum]
MKNELTDFLTRRRGGAEKTKRWNCPRLFSSAALRLCVIHFALLALMLSQPACTSTITPTPVTPARASYDGDAQTSGVLAITDAGFVVTPRWRERYNLAIARHGAEWRPALAADHGVVARTDGTYLASREAMEKAIVMFSWIRMGRAPAQ